MGGTGDNGQAGGGGGVKQGEREKQYRRGEARLSDGRRDYRDERSR